MTTPNDAVWLCHGCKHGFMRTFRTRQAGYFILTGPGDGPEASDKTADSSQCLCDHPVMVACQDRDDGDAATASAVTKRAVINWRIIKCDGFEPREPK